MDRPRKCYTNWSKSERERKIPHDIPYMWNLKYDTNELIQETDRLTDIENILVVAKGDMGRERDGVGVWDSVQFSSVAQSCPTLWDPMDCSTPGFLVHHQLPEFTQTLVHWVGDAIQPSHPHPLLLLPSIFPSIRVFSSESVLRIRWPNDWSFSFSISPSNEHPGLISFRTDWLDLLAVQGTLKNLLQHRSSKASVLWCSAFFIVQLSHPYMTTRKEP